MGRIASKKSCSPLKTLNQFLTTNNCPRHNKQGFHIPIRFFPYSSDYGFSFIVNDYQRVNEALGNGVIQAISTDLD